MENKEKLYNVLTRIISIVVLCGMAYFKWGWDPYAGQPDGELKRCLADCNYNYSYGDGDLLGLLSDCENICYIPNKLDSSYEGLLEKALKSINKGKHADAINYLSRAIDLPTDESKYLAYELRADEYLGLGEVDLAYADAKMAISVAPDKSSMGYSIAGIIQSVGGEHEIAISFCDKAIENYTGQATVVATCAIVHYSGGSQEISEEYITKALKTSPNDRDIQDAYNMIYGK